jgi:hypothetical protein
MLEARKRGKLIILRTKRELNFPLGLGLLWRLPGHSGWDRNAMSGFRAMFLSKAKWYWGYHMRAG